MEKFVLNPICSSVNDNNIICFGSNIICARGVRRKKNVDFSEKGQTILRTRLYTHWELETSTMTKVKKIKNLIFKS